MYTILILRRVQKELSLLSLNDYKQVRDVINALKEEPPPSGCVKLKGRDGWRIRQGRYRIIYEIDDKQRTVTVLHIGHRRDVYR